jgi:hypothetical protein
VQYSTYTLKSNIFVLFRGNGFASAMDVVPSVASTRTRLRQADPRQVNRLKLYFRQGYAFGGSARHEAARAPPGFSLREPASLCFNSGKIILYGTEKTAERQTCYAFRFRAY